MRKLLVAKTIHLSGLLIAWRMLFLAYIVLRPGDEEVLCDKSQFSVVDCVTLVRGENLLLAASIMWVVYHHACNNHKNISDRELSLTTWFLNVTI